MRMIADILGCPFQLSILGNADSEKEALDEEEMPTGRELEKLTVKKEIDVHKVVIMGGSRIAVRTAQYVPDYMQVKIVDNDLNRCNRLTELLDDRTMIINGDGREMDLLIEEGLKNTEAFVALTGSYEATILACLAAKRMAVNNTEAEVENIDKLAEKEVGYGKNGSIWSRYQKIHNLDKKK